MSHLHLIIAPDPLLKQKAQAVSQFDQELVTLVENMFDLLYHHQGIGLAGNMVGILQRIIIIDIAKDHKPSPLVFINPEIIDQSDEVQTHEEASLSYPGISAPITRPQAITLKYQDLKGIEKETKLNDFLATVVQHEMDYLEGRSYLDHLSRLKRDNLLKKMKKYKSLSHAHAHDHDHDHDHHCEHC